MCNGFEDQILPELIHILRNDDGHLIQEFVGGHVTDMNEIFLPDQGHQVIFELIDILTSLDEIDKSLSFPLFDPLHQTKFSQSVFVHEEGQA
jgi:hypothetical protein